MSEPNQDLWQCITAHDALQQAWFKVSANDGSAGGDGITLRDFSANLFSNLTELRAELLQGIYRSGPFRKVSIPKKKPGYRILTIPSVRDRVVHASIAATLTPLFEPLFSDASFAYRPNRGVSHAAAKIERWRDKGYSIVIEADVVSYFDNVNHDMLLEKVEDALNNRDSSASVIALLSLLLADQSRALGTPGKGLVHGSPLSPLLANLYLDALDDEIEEQGVKIVRFADDFVILCKSYKKAEQALQHATRILNLHGLQLHDDGTRIVNFDKGFDFIGYLFVKSLAIKETPAPDIKPLGKPVKSTVTDEGIIELGEQGAYFDQGKRVLYLIDPEHILTIRNQSFSVVREDGAELIAIPHHRVGRIEVSSTVAFASPVVDLALRADVELSIVDGFGQTRGYLTRASAKRSGDLLAQVRALDDSHFRITVARLIVEARMRTQRQQLMRLNREKHLVSILGVLDGIASALKKLPYQKTVLEVQAMEAVATKLYWPALGSLLNMLADTVVFQRSRPAADMFNAAINYLTGVLERDIRASIQSTGLHPGIAFLHGTRNGHDGLVYDLMEPFRAALTEGLVVFLFNANRLRDDMFFSHFEHGVEIKAEGRKALILGYESAVAKRVNKPEGGGKLSWRNMMRHQALGLLRAVREKQPSLFIPYQMED